MSRIAFLYFWRKVSGQTILNHPKLIIAILLFLGISSMFMIGIRGRWGSVDNFDKQMKGMENYWETRAHLKAINKSIEKYVTEKGVFPASLGDLEEAGYFQKNLEMNRMWKFTIQGRSETALLIATSTQYHEKGEGREIVFDRGAGKFVVD